MRAVARPHGYERRALGRHGDGGKIVERIVAGCLPRPETMKGDMLSNASGRAQEPPRQDLVVAAALASVLVAMPIALAAKRMFAAMPAVAPLAVVLFVLLLKTCALDRMYRAAS